MPALVLAHVDPACPDDINYLFAVMFDRLFEPSTNISHKTMPTWSDHLRFIQTEPYREHYIIRLMNSSTSKAVGTCYLTKANEIGLWVSPMERRQGIGRWAIQEIMRQHEPPFLANIAPGNSRSVLLFYKLGFREIERMPEQLVMRYG